PDIAGVDPSEHEILIGRDAHRTVAISARELAEYAHLLAGEVTERHTRNHHREAELFLRQHVRHAPSCVRLVAGLKDRDNRWSQSGARNTTRGHSRRDVAHRWRRLFHPIGLGFGFGWIDLEGRHVAA